MEREELLKSLIKEKYRSVLEFSKAADIPESSIRNIFSRGMDSVNAGTLVKICKYLNIDLESLMAGSLSVRPNYTKETVWADYVGYKDNTVPATPVFGKEQLQAAFWGGDKDLTQDEKDAMWDDVERFAAFLALKKKQEKQTDD